MRVVKEINHPICKVTIFNWNSKYLIKLEQGDIEQTFKIDEMDVLEEKDLDEVLNESFMKAAQKRFKEMHDALEGATEHLL
ncbi:hypothetical protein E1176_14150 [Fulvivirga sp. RKSG066]|uniref:hypothetical protein n=1 Tax=Fulvivirga aurantia TaxID=2529383 RepID=UPI0012BB7A41|nr:hypothetical protein [Fulvivirga aurantia]MTI22169.1 hypothetical protein [Fulvivirga aurantia]